MPPLPDHYQTLGVDDDASQTAIKKAYRALAKTHHPDRNAGDADAEARFKDIQEAYDTLGDETRRAAYDRARRDPRGQRFETGGTPFDGFSGFPEGGRFARTPDGTYVRVDATGAGPEADFLFSGGGMDDLFSQMFGGGTPGGGPQPRSRQPGGRDVEATVELSFAEALAGGSRQFQTPDGETIRLNVPKGARDGLTLRLQGRGQPGPRGDRGDLYLRFRIAPDPRFRREGDDLFAGETVSAVEAMLGTTREIETATGRRVKLTIPAGTQPGARLRLRGQGVATADGTGDLFVEVHVATPALDEAARTSLRTWAEAHDVT